MGLGLGLGLGLGFGLGSANHVREQCGEQARLARAVGRVARGADGIDLVEEEERGLGLGLGLGFGFGLGLGLGFEATEPPRS